MLKFLASTAKTFIILYNNSADVLSLIKIIT